MGKHEAPEPDIAHMDEPKPSVVVTDMEGLLSAIFGQNGPQWSEPHRGTPEDLANVTMREHIVAHECDSLEVFFCDPPQHKGTEYMGLGFHKGTQELVILFTQETWTQFSDLITLSINTRNETADKPWGAS